MTEEGDNPREIRPLDATDRHILNILTANSRTKLVKIAREIQLSVDSTKKRIVRLERDGVIDKYTIFPGAKAIGLPLAVHIYVKLKSLTKERYDELIDSLLKNSRVIDLMSMLGDYDLYIVVLGKDTSDLDRLKFEIKQKFSDLIGDWKEVLVTKIYRLEEFNF